MKKLGNLKLSEAKVMDVHEMKAITGGQEAYKPCRNTSTSTGVNADVTCGGECPTVGDVTGTGEKPIPLTCKSHSVSGFPTACICK